MSGTTPDPEKELEEQEVDDHALRRLNIVRGYVLLFVGVGLIIFSFIPPVKPATLTLGGALVGFNPVLQASFRSGKIQS